MYLVLKTGALALLAPAKLVFWWRYRVSQAVCQWLVIGVSLEKGHWDAPHFGRLCRPLNGSAMARRRGGLRPVPGGECAIWYVHARACLCARARVTRAFAHHVGAVSRDISDCSGLSRSF